MLGAATAIVVPLAAFLGNSSSNKAYTIADRNSEISSLQRANSGLREENSTLKGRMDTLERERTEATEELAELQADLDETNNRLAQLEEVPTPSGGSIDGGKVFKYTIPWSAWGTGVDLDTGIVGQSNTDISYRPESGRRSLAPGYGNPLSVDVGVRDAERSQCQDAIEKRPIAQNGVWVPAEVGAQACATSTYGISRLTVTNIAENGDIAISQVYWTS